MDSHAVTKPFISIIIPTRNRVAFLKEAVASVSSQDYLEREIIVVDDASEDGTWEWLSSLQAPGIVTFRLERHGERSAARNLGLKHAKGEFVLFLDDDDLLAPGGLRYLCRALLRRRDAIAAIGARLCFDERQHRQRAGHPRWRFTKWVWRDVVAGWAPVCGQTLFRKSLLLQMEGWNAGLSIAEDHELWLRLAFQGPALVLPRIVLRVRVHAGQTGFAGFRRKEWLRLKARLAAQLAPERQLELQQLLNSHRYLVVGQAALKGNHYSRALACHLIAASKAPRQLWSPLSGPTLVAGLVKSAVCLFQPRWVVGCIRGIRAACRSALGRNTGVYVRRTRPE